MNRIQSIARYIVLIKEARDLQCAIKLAGQLQADLAELACTVQCGVIQQVFYSLDRSRADKVTFSVKSMPGHHYTVIVRPTFGGIHLSVHGKDAAGLKGVVTRTLHDRLMAEQD